MQLPPVSYTIQRGQIGIDTQDAQVDITQRQADLQISQPEADLNIETTPSKLTIDQTQAWRNMGLFSVEEAVRQGAQEGQQKAQEGVARRAREGDEMMKIENGTDAIQNIAERKTLSPREDIRNDWMPWPQFAPDINYQPAEVNIEATPNEPVINATHHQPQFNYQRGDVKTSLTQEPRFEINVDMKSWNQSQYDLKI